MVGLQRPWRCQIEGVGVLCLGGAVVNACEGRSIGFRVQFGDHKREALGVQSRRCWLWSCYGG